MSTSSVLNGVGKNTTCDGGEDLGNDQIEQQEYETLEVVADVLASLSSFCKTERKMTSLDTSLKIEHEGKKEVAIEADGRDEEGRKRRADEIKVVDEIFPKRHPKRRPGKNRRENGGSGNANTLKIIPPLKPRRNVDGSSNGMGDCEISAIDDGVVCTDLHGDSGDGVGKRRAGRRRIPSPQFRNKQSTPEWYDNRKEPPQHAGKNFVHGSSKGSSTPVQECESPVKSVGNPPHSSGSTCIRQQSSSHLEDKHSTRALEQIAQPGSPNKPKPKPKPDSHGQLHNITVDHQAASTLAGVSTASTPRPSGSKLGMIHSETSLVHTEVRGGSGAAPTTKPGSATTTQGQPGGGTYYPSPYQPLYVTYPPQGFSVAYPPMALGCPQYPQQHQQQQQQQVQHVYTTVPEGHTSRTRSGEGSSMTSQAVTSGSPVPSNVPLSVVAVESGGLMPVSPSGSRRDQQQQVQQEMLQRHQQQERQRAVMAYLPQSLHPQHASHMQGTVSSQGYAAYVHVHAQAQASMWHRHQQPRHEQGVSSATVPESVSSAGNQSNGPAFVFGSAGNTAQGSPVASQAWKPSGTSSGQDPPSSHKSPARINSDSTTRNTDASPKQLETSTNPALLQQGVSTVVADAYNISRGNEGVTETTVPGNVSVGGRGPTGVGINGQAHIMPAPGGGVHILSPYGHHPHYRLQHHPHSTPTMGPAMAPGAPGVYNGCVPPGHLQQQGNQVYDGLQSHALAYARVQAQQHHINHYHHVRLHQDQHQMMANHNLQMRPGSTLHPAPPPGMPMAPQMTHPSDVFRRLGLGQQNLQPQQQHEIMQGQPFYPRSFLARAPGITNFMIKGDESTTPSKTPSKSSSKGGGEGQEEVEEEGARGTDCSLQEGGKNEIEGTANNVGKGSIVKREGQGTEANSPQSPQSCQGGGGTTPCKKDKRNGDGGIASRDTTDNQKDQGHGQGKTKGTISRTGGNADEGRVGGSNSNHMSCGSTSGTHGETDGGGACLGKVDTKGSSDISPRPSDRSRSSSTSIANRIRTDDRATMPSQDHIGQKRQHPRQHSLPPGQTHLVWENYHNSTVRELANTESSAFYGPNSSGSRRSDPSTNEPQHIEPPHTAANIYNHQSHHPNLPDHAYYPPRYGVYPNPSPGGLRGGLMAPQVLPGAPTAAGTGVGFSVGSMPTQPTGGTLSGGLPPYTVIYR